VRIHPEELGPDVGATLVSARPLVEYRAMLGLSEADLAGRRILDCPGGGSSFVAEASALGADAVAVDPLYASSDAEIAARVRRDVLRGNRFVREHPERYVWTWFRSADHHRDLRGEGGERFVRDLAAHRERYVAAALPNLPFADGAFDLALSSHLLFTYADRHDFAFHVDAVRELTRVAAEARFFPLVDLTPRRYPLLDELVTALAAEGIEARVTPVDYEFQRGGNEMLVCGRPRGRRGAGAARADPQLGRGVRG
jgi:hypothetical protein